jgi:taurine dioxygenase
MKQDFASAVRQTDDSRSASRFRLRPLPDSTFGAELRFDADDARRAVEALESDPEPLRRAFYGAQGLLVMKDLHAITRAPELLVRVSRVFGPEVENYHETLTARNMIHPDVPEILVLSNQPPANREPPPQPDPPRTADGRLPVQFPHRKGWHTDQSFRRPPPDISLFYAVVPAPKGEAQTLYGDGVAAYEALSAEQKKRIEGVEGLHVLPWMGRSEEAVRAGETPQPLLPHQRPQRQPLVRVHPVTGRRALYLCEDAQMDWIEGPIVGMTPGPDGEGAALVYELMTHFTQPRYTYVHEWDPGDLVIYDNRCLIHCGTWYDSARHPRVMWRTTVRGNPGPEYAGEKRSWIPDSGARPMEGLDDG